MNIIQTVICVYRIHSINHPNFMESTPHGDKKIVSVNLLLVFIKKIYNSGSMILHLLKKGDQ